MDSRLAVAFVIMGRERQLIPGVTKLLFSRNAIVRHAGVLFLMLGLLVGCLGQDDPAPVPEANQVQVFIDTGVTQQEGVFDALAAEFQRLNPEYGLVNLNE